MTMLGFRGVHPLMLLFFPAALAALFGGFWLLRRYRHRLSGRSRGAYLASFGVLVLSVAAAFPAMRHSTYALLYYLCSLAAFAALNLALAVGALLGPNPEPVRHLASRRRFVAGGVFAAAGTLVTMAGVDASTGEGESVLDRRIDLPRHPDAAPGRPLRVSLVTDLHAGFFLPRAYLDEALKHVEAFSPDVILFGGDLVEYELDALDQTRGFFRDLTKAAPVYAVLGNHDCYVDGDAVAAFHRLNGVRPLRDETALLEGAFGRFALCGLRDVKEGADFRCLRGLDPASTILLAHNPMLGLMTPGSLAPWLTLSGHTHGGQICLPLAGPLVNQADRRILAGMNVIDGRRLAVSAGLGYSGLPVRIMCPPDVTNIVVS